MGYIIACAYIILWSTMLVYVCREKQVSWYQAVAMVVYSVILAEYVFGLMGCLSAGVWIILGISIIPILYLSIRVKGQIKNVITTDLYIVLVILAVIYIINLGKHIYQIDEYTHWALIVKDMYYKGVMANDGMTCTSYIEYPPAMALFEYFVCKLNGVYRERDLFRAFNIITVFSILSLGSTLITRMSVKWKKIVTVIGLIVVPCVFYYPYSDLFVDCILGLLFAFIMYHVWNQSQTCIVNYINIALATAVLVLTKSSGKGLVYIVWFGIAVGILTGVYSRKELLKRGAISVVSYAAANYSWKYALAIGVGQENVQWNLETINVQSISELLHSFGSKEMGILKQFLHDYIYPQPSLNLVSLSYIMWIIVLACGVWLLYRKNKKLAVVTGLTSAVGIIIYSIYLLLLYYFVWKAALTDGSFYRYLNTIYMGIIVTECALIYECYKGESLKISGRKLVVGLILVISFSRYAELAKVVKSTVNYKNYKPYTYENAYRIYENENAVYKNTIVVSLEDINRKNIECVKEGYMAVPYRYTIVQDENDINKLLEKYEYVYILQSSGNRLISR